MADNKMHFLDYLVILAGHKRLIIGITLTAALVTAVYSVLMPPVYKATTTILPPQQGNSGVAAQILAQFGGSAGVAADAVGMRTPTELYVTLLKSRTISDRIIDRFGLMQLYESKFRETVRQRLAAGVYIRAGTKDGTVTISVENEDPKKAAKIADAFVEELKNLSRSLAVTEAGQRRLFFEEQLESVRKSLLKAEQALQGFQERTGAIKVDEQAKALIQGIAHLRAEIAAREVQVRVMRTYATQANPDLQEAEEGLKGLGAELRKLEARGGVNPDTLMPAGKLPSVGADYLRRMRELKYNETLYEILIKQYELARLDESRDAAIIQVMDKAVPPEKRERPNRTRMVLVAGFTAAMFSLIAALIMEHLKKAFSDPGIQSKLLTLGDQFGISKLFSKSQS
ncbi:MAG: Wzz/FepE/Etk N-terminal domain-containing protein [Pseudomonadota bacterium]